MIGYVTLGVKDLAAAKAFYLELLADMYVQLIFDMDRIAMIGRPGEPMLSVCVPYNEEAPSAGNGNMVALAPGSTEAVDKLYAKAISMGATSDGEPGWRIEGVFYGAYFFDKDGNKVCFFFMPS